MTSRAKLPRALTVAELERVNYATGIGSRNMADQMAKLAIIATDAHSAQRRAECRCPACEYLGRYRLAGQAFTAWKCQLCLVEQPSHPNTAVPRLCLSCAGAYGLCVSCGGDVEGIHRGRMTGRKAKKPLGPIEAEPSK